MSYSASDFSDDVVRAILPANTIRDLEDNVHTQEDLEAWARAAVKRHKQATDLLIRALTMLGPTRASKDICKFFAEERVDE